MMNLLSEDSYAVALASIIAALLIPVAASINTYTSFADRLYELALANATDSTIGGPLLSHVSRFQWYW